MNQRPPRPAATGLSGLEGARVNEPSPEMITMRINYPNLLGIRTGFPGVSRHMNSGILGFFSIHKAFAWGLALLTTIGGLIAAVTADSALGIVATVGGVALGMMLLREKVRDLRVENWKKQAEDLARLLAQERLDHEQTRQRLRACLGNATGHETPR